MRAKLISAFIFFALVFSQFANGQQFIGKQEQSQIIWTGRIKLLNQFFNRFNFLENSSGDKVLEPISQAERKISLNHLFPILYLDSTNKGKVFLFLEAVCNEANPISLNFEDKDWYAKAFCLGTLNGKPIEVELTLQIQINSDRSVEWVIVGAYCKKLLSIENGKDLFLAANANELNFLRLITGLEKPENAYAFTKAGFKSDHLSIVLYLIHTSALKLSTVKYITYEFLQVPGWIFSVREKDAPSFNSGWLIHSLEKANDKEKRQYIKDSLHLAI